MDSKSKKLIKLFLICCLVSVLPAVTISVLLNDLWWILVGDLLIGALLYAIYNQLIKKFIKVPMPKNDDIKDDQILKNDDIKDDQNVSILLEEVNRKKKIVQELKLHEIIPNLYFEIYNYPDWIENNINSEYICHLITEVRKDKNKIIIRFKNKEYGFSFKEESGMMDINMGELRVFDGNKQVFLINMTYDFQEESPEWKFYDIEGFMEGDWIKNLRELYQEIKIFREELSKKKEEEAKRIEVDNIKRNFDIR